jgi:cell division protein ZapA
LKRSVAVQIAGQKIMLRSDGDDETLHKLAAHVDVRLREIQKQTRTADTQTLALLAALQITEELFAERKAKRELKKQVREKSESLLQFLQREARL